MGDCAAVIIVSAESEWRIVRAQYPAITVGMTPYGEWFATTLRGASRESPVIVMHGGWGKIAAAASAQYALDRWGIVLARRTVVYDLIERMGDAAAVIVHYATDLDLTWLGGHYPQPVRAATLATDDADLDPLGVADLPERYGAVAGDWESGAIAYVAARKGTRCLILRGVSDLVGTTAVRPTTAACTSLSRRGGGDENALERVSGLGSAGLKRRTCRVGCVIGGCSRWHRCPEQLASRGMSASRPGLG